MHAKLTILSVAILVALMLARQWVGDGPTYGLDLTAVVACARNRAHDVA